ncbi:MAG: response regulator [Rhodospirillaceae bacterium]
MANILVIDDCKVSRMVLRSIFEKYHHQVDEANTGYQGEKIFRSKAYDIVFIDIFMPEQDGLQTIINIRRENQNIPLIVMSGGGNLKDFNYLNYAIKLGATYAYTKPVSQDNVDDIIKLL